MQKSGMVMSLEDNKAIVMTPDGEFCPVTAPPGTEIGSVLEWSVRDVGIRVNAPIRSRSWGGRIRYSALGVAAAMALAVGVWQVDVHQVSQRPYAYVAIDISPGITLTVNRQMSVIHATGLDSDGKSLIAAAKTNTSLTDAVQNLVHTAEVNGLVPGRDNILIATAPGSGATSDQIGTIENVVKTSIRQALGNNGGGSQSDHVYTYQVSDTVWNAATQLHVSPAKVAAYLTEMNHGHQVPFNQLHLAQLSNQGATSTQAPMVIVRLDNLQAVESLIQTAISEMKSATVPPSGVTGGRLPSEAVPTNQTQTSSAKAGTSGGWSVV